MRRVKAQAYKQEVHFFSFSPRKGPDFIGNTPLDFQLRKTKKLLTMLVFFFPRKVGKYH